MIIRSQKFARFLLLTLTAALAWTTVSVALAQNSKMKPIAIVAFNSIDDLFEDANFLGSLVGQGELAAQYQPMVRGFTPGLDHSKPIGLIVQSDGITPSGALCIPVTDLKQLLAVLKNFGVMSEDKGDGNWEISAQGQTLVGRESDGWLFLSMPGMLGDTPADPEEFFGALTEQYDLGVRLHVQNIPEAYKQMILGNLQMGMQAGMQNRLEDESDEEYEARKEMAEARVDQLKQAAQDLDELTLGVAVDGEQQRTFIDVAYTAIAGSQLAEQDAINSNPKTDFAGFFQPDAAMMMSFASKFGESDIARVEQMFDAMGKQVETAIDDQAGSKSEEERKIIKSAVSDFMEALQATLQAGKMDGGAVLNISSSSLSFVAGGFIGDPSKVESGIKKLSELAKKEDAEFPGIQWNSSSHADVQFHTLNVPLSEVHNILLQQLPMDVNEEAVRKLFGDTVDVAIGIGKKSAYFALGRDCIEAINEIMDTSAASPQKSVPPMEMTFALAQILEAVGTFVDEEEKPKFEMIANMLTNEANGRDHVRIVVQPIANGVRTRIEAEEGVLRAIGMSAMAAQMEAAGAGAGAGF